MNGTQPLSNPFKNGQDSRFSPHPSSVTPCWSFPSLEITIFDTMGIHNSSHRPEGSDQIICIVMPSCPKPEPCILGSLAPLCPQCSQKIHEFTLSETLSQARMNTISLADIEGPFTTTATSSASPRSNIFVTYPPPELHQTLAMNLQHPQQPGPLQAPYTSQPQVSSQQFISMGHDLQQMQLCTPKVMCL